MAVLLANRGSTQGQPVSVTVDLSELPGFKASTHYTVRDLWKHKQVDGVLTANRLTLQAASQQSQFFLIIPQGHI